MKGLNLRGLWHRGAFGQEPGLLPGLVGEFQAGGLVGPQPRLPVDGPDYFQDMIHEGEALAAPEA